MEQQEESILGIPKNRIDKEGMLQFYNDKKKWITRLFYLCGCALYYHKKGYEKIVGPILIKDAVISVSNDHPNPKKKKFAFKVTAPQEDNVSGTFYSNVKDEETRNAWLGAFNENKSKDAVDIITTVKVKQSASMRVKKNVSSAVAGSSAGKDIIRKFVGKKALRSIDIIKDIVLKTTGDKKKVTEIENSVIKLSAKAILLWQNGDLTEEDVNEVIPAIRSLWLAVLNYCQMPFTYDVQTIKTLTNELMVGFNNIMAPYVTERTLGLLKETMTFLTQEQMLDSIFMNESEDALRKDIVTILNTEWAKERFQSQVV